MKFRFTILLAVIFSLLFFNSCQEEPPVTQEPDPEPPVYDNGTGEIGTIGGTVRIVDPASELNGTFIQIPNGALGENKTISISLSTTDVPDPNAIVIKFEPVGLNFLKPVKIGLPYSSNQIITNLSAYYYDDDNEIIEQLLVDSLDVQNRIVIASTKHFSEFYTGENDVFMEIEMVNINNKIGVVAYPYGKINGVNNFLSIPTSFEYFMLRSLINVQQVLNSTSYMTASFFTVELYKYCDGYLCDDELIATKKLTVRKEATNRYWVDIFEGDNVQSPIVYEHDRVVFEDEYHLWWGGEALVYTFDNAQIDPSKEYYVKVKWHMRENFQPSHRCTFYYEATNYNDKKMLNELTNFDGDVDNNYVQDIYQITVGNAPNEPSNPYPEIDDWNIPINLELSWTCTDPDGDPLTYDIYFGLSGEPPLIKSNYSSNSYSVSSLNNNMQYNWKIVAKDNHGNSASGEIWYFTTISGTGNQPPNVPTNEQPENGASNQPLSLVLSWTCSDPENDPLIYDVYFGIEPNPPLVSNDQTDTNFDPGTLSESTTYYWKIIAMDDHSNTTAGGLWTFSTISGGGNLPPNDPTNPSPPNNAEDQPIDVDISWTCTDPENDPLTYDVYFGTESDPPLVSSNQTLNTFDPGTLEESTTYNWKIVAKDDHGNSTPGPIWNFETVVGETFTLLQEWYTPDYQFYGFEKNGTEFYTVSGTYPTSFLSLSLDNASIAVNYSNLLSIGILDIAWDNNYIWSTDGDYNIYKHLIDDNMTIVGTYPRANLDYIYICIEWDGTNLWAFSFNPQVTGDFLLEKFDSQMNVIQTFQTDLFIGFGFIIEGSTIWAVILTDLYKYEIVGQTLTYVNDWYDAFDTEFSNIAKDGNIIYLNDGQFRAGSLIRKYQFNE